MVGAFKKDLRAVRRCVSDVLGARGDGVKIRYGSTRFGAKRYDWSEEKAPCPCLLDWSVVPIILHVDPLG